MTQEVTMDRRNRGSQWVLIAGILTVLLGLIHVAATPVIFSTMSDQLSAADKLTFLYMYIATGAAVIFVGWLVMYGSRGLRTSERWAWITTLAAGVFMSLLGIGAILAMSDNPFAYLTLVFAALELVPLWLYRQEFQQASKG
jgi:uncharacterized membrane protein HdeD (DUF308 family)